jgi:hypothetical protein
MAKETKPTKRNTRTSPKAATLLKYLMEYMAENNIGGDQPNDVVIQRLKDSIVDEALAG